MVKIVKVQQIASEGFFHVYLNDHIEKAFLFYTLPDVYQPSEAQAFERAKTWAKMLEEFTPINEEVYACPTVRTTQEEEVQN